MVLLPFTALAQNFQGMNQADMQKMMQQMQKMQTCMEGIDQSKLEAMESRSRQMEAEVKNLCAAGKRDAAQEKAIAFSREMAADATLKRMQQCGKMMQGAMPESIFTDLTDPDREQSEKHVCDELR